jgi:hypothetical protein
MRATCLNCTTSFETDRTDSRFCKATCKADYHRTHGSTHQHEDLNRYKSKSCEFCGNLFWFNAYGDRSGKRVPTYCKNACRVAAHRAWKRDAAAAHERAQQNARSWEAFRERAQQTQQATPPPPPPPPPNDPADFRARLAPPTKYDVAGWYRWLGVPEMSSFEVCSKAIRKINLKHHSDTNGGAVWPHLANVNAAWDYLKRRVFKPANR